MTDYVMKESPHYHNRGYDLKVFDGNQVLAHLENIPEEVVENAVLDKKKPYSPHTEYELKAVPVGSMLPVDVSLYNKAFGQFVRLKVAKDSLDFLQFSEDEDDKKLYEALKDVLGNHEQKLLDMFERGEQ